MKLKLLALTATTTAMLALSGCMPSMTKGDAGAKTTATGYAGGGNAQAAADLERCDRPVGTMSLLEDETSSTFREFRALFAQQGITSTIPVLRLLAQQSNCFAIVERGRGFEAMERERALRETGELRDTSNFGKGQMVAADFTLTPTIIFKNNDAGGMLGALGLPGALIGGAMKSKEAQAMLTLVENRSGLQLAVAEGSAKARDFKGLLGGWGGGVGGVLGGYTKTAEGKVIVASLTDAFNNIVKAVKNYKAQESSGPQGHGSGGRLQFN